VAAAGAAVTGVADTGFVAVAVPPDFVVPDDVDAVLLGEAPPGTDDPGTVPTGISADVIGAVAGDPSGNVAASPTTPEEDTSSTTCVAESCAGTLSANVAMMAQVAATLSPAARALDAGATGPFFGFAERDAAERTDAGAITGFSEFSVIVIFLVLFVFLVITVVMVIVVVMRSGRDRCPRRVLGRGHSGID
jgi:hypothetical protein